MSACQTNKKICRSVPYLDIDPFLLLEALVLAHQTLSRRHDCDVKCARVVKTGIVFVSESEIDLVIDLLRVREEGRVQME